MPTGHRAALSGRRDSMTEDDVHAMILEWMSGKSLGDAAAEIGVSKPWLCMLAKGQRRPCGKILDHLGIQRQSRARPFKGEPPRPFRAAC